MAHGRHKTNKRPGDIGFDPKWSGVSYAPHCDHGCRCADDNERLHRGGPLDALPPRCDDFKAPSRDCPHR